MIHVDTLRHRYDNGHEAVKGISFEVARGECFGFLGPNGAGKSTTIKVVTGQLPLQSGRVTVAGHDLSRPPRDFYERIGVSFELPNVYGKLTVLENLELYRRLFCGETEDPRRLLDRVGLLEAADKRAEACSRGMLQRLVFARSLLNRPEVLFLDEPPGGLDPDIALGIRELITEARERGVTVFLTTHNMWEADVLCDRVAFLHDGQIRALDTPRALKLAMGERTLRAEVRNGGEAEVVDLAMDAAADRARLSELLEGGEVLTLHSREATLEDAFVRLVGRAL